ncbi:GGDEF domain-containing protein [Bacillus sp. APMAM]|nr:GGDEF domain-containing protein [Bacillus sp. APMAM]RTZ54633.1 sensor domain-containing diguanylate cyclase [Bacillus sp. SAJ1]
MLGFCLGILGLILGVIYSEPIKRIVWKGYKERTKNEKRIYQLVESSKDIIYYCEIKPQFKYRYLSPAIDEILRPNLSKDSLKNPYITFEIVHPDDYHLVEKKIAGKMDYNKPIIVRWRDVHGDYKWFEEFATPIYENGEIVALHGIIRNIDEKMMAQKELEYKVEHDPLTGIYNRAFFEKQKKLYNEDLDESVGIVLCDLDELKWMNDNFGHQMGDKLIIQTSKLLNKFSNENSMVIRIGGDEFAFLVIKTNELSLQHLSEQIKKEVMEYNEKHPHFMMKMSIGYAFEASSIGKMEELFTHADQKMYQDKNNRKPVFAR